jgi:SAM-dependent methyltransferase
LLHEGDSLPRDFGMLALWDVIEHVSEPDVLLRACREHLAPGGVLLLETPDEGALLRSIVRAAGTLRMPGLDLRGGIYYRAHRFYFTRASMTRLLERLGFSKVRYFAEHTMFQKELLKQRFYQRPSRAKELFLRGMFATLKGLPFMANKMVAVAVKSYA